MPPHGRVRRRGGIAAVLEQILVSGEHHIDWLETNRQIGDVADLSQQLTD